MDMVASSVSACVLQQALSLLTPRAPPLPDSSPPSLSCLPGLGQSGLFLPALVPASGLFLSTHPAGLAFNFPASSYHVITPTDGGNCEAGPRDQSQGDSCWPVYWQLPAWWPGTLWVAVGLGAGPFESPFGVM